MHVLETAGATHGGLVAKSCPTLASPDCNLPGYSVHILQAKILEWVAVSLRGNTVMQIEAIDMHWAGGVEQSHVLKPHLSQQKSNREFCNLLAHCLRAWCKLTTLC